MLFQKFPSYDYLNIIGCLFYATKWPKGDKFEARVVKPIFLGYGVSERLHAFLI